LMQRSSGDPSTTQSSSPARNVMQQIRRLSARKRAKPIPQNQELARGELQNRAIKRRFALLLDKNRFRHIFHSSEDVCAGHGEIANFLDKEANFSY